MRKQLFFLISSFAFILSSCTYSSSKLNHYEAIAGEYHYISGYEPLIGNESVQVIIEIPTGTTQKWEVNKSDGKLHWEVKDDQPRIIEYLGYPGNYGMVPRTLLSYENGGDGDPLDVLVLGPPVERGRVVKSKLIGVLNLLDGREQDDKLIAVMEGTAFYNVNSVEDLKREFPGVLPIIETWFESYKGPGKLKSSGFSSVGKAKSILTKAIKTYASQHNQRTSNEPKNK